MHLYAHIPFCAAKCPYCAFYSVAGAAPALVAGYARRLARELSLRGLSGAAPETLYIGGGTPSLLGAEGVARVMRACGAAPGATRETTLECNPADATPAFAAAVLERGVTRVSLGVQSFDGATLRILGRRHGAAEAEAAFHAFRRAGARAVALDLIAAVPGAPRDAFRRSLERAAGFAPEHISVYPLSIEEGAEFHARGLRPPGDEETMDALAEAEDFLSARGYERYEISNYRKIPQRGADANACLHNLAVWRGADYAGAGPAAASRIGLERRVNAPDLRAWSQALDAGALPPGAVEALAPEDDERERFITRLRLSEGISADPATETGRARLETCARLVRAGLMRAADQAETIGAAGVSEPRRGAVHTLTRRGREVADSIAAEFC